MLDLAEEAALHQALIALAAAGLLQSCSDISDGGCAVAFARASFPQSLGIDFAMTLHTDHPDNLPFLIRERLYSEIPSSVVISVSPADVAAVQALLAQHPKLWLAQMGPVTTGNYTIRVNGVAVVNAPLSALNDAWSTGLEAQLHDEVLA